MAEVSYATSSAAGAGNLRCLGEGENPINTDVIQLHRAWVNESVSPELLPYEERIVEETTALVENQEEILDELKKQDADQAWTGSLYTQDIDR